MTVGAPRVPLARLSDADHADFLKDFQDWLAGRRMMHMGKWRYAAGGDSQEPDGLAIWDQINLRSQGEGRFYVFADEVEALAISAPAVREHIARDPRPWVFIDLGVGGAAALREKVGRLLGVLGEKVTAYVGVDRTAESLEVARAVMGRDFPHLSFTGLHADFLQDALSLPETPRRLIAVFGLTALNLEADPRDPRAVKAAMVQTLSAIRRHVRAGDRLLLTHDFNARAAEIEAAYGEEKPWWDHMLARAAQVLPFDGGFDPAQLVFEPRYIARTQALAHCHVVARPLHFHLGGEAFSLPAGQRLYSHGSFKPSRERLFAACARAGLRRLQSGPAVNGRISVHLFAGDEPA